MMPRTDRRLLVNAMLGQFITGFAGRRFVVALPTIANTLHADMWEHSGGARDGPPNQPVVTAPG